MIKEVGHVCLKELTRGASKAAGSAAVRVTVSTGLPLIHDHQRLRLGLVSGINKVLSLWQKWNELLWKVSGVSVGFRSHVERLDDVHLQNSVRGRQYGPPHIARLKTPILLLLLERCWSFVILTVFSI